MRNSFCSDFRQVQYDLKTLILVLTLILVFEDHVDHLQHKGPNENMVQTWLQSGPFQITFPIYLQHVSNLYTHYGRSNWPYSFLMTTQYWLAMWYKTEQYLFVWKCGIRIEPRLPLPTKHHMLLPVILTSNTLYPWSSHHILTQSLRTSPSIIPSSVHDRGC